MNMIEAYLLEETQIIDEFDDGVCDICRGLGRVYEAIVFSDLQLPGEVICLCDLCLQRQ